jgi:tmRNA-binding protein
VFATHFGGDLADAVAVVGQLWGQTGRPLRVQQLLFQLDYLQKTIKIIQVENLTLMPLKSFWTTLKVIIDNIHKN